MKMRSRYPGRIEYVVSSNWDGLTGGTAQTSGGGSVIYDTPETYGGRGKGICPDELFVAAVLGCLNNTFLDFQRRFEMELVSLDLAGKAVALFKDGGYRIAELTVTGHVVVGEGELETGQRCVELMKEYCHLTRSISGCIPIHFDITVTERPV
ncbi:MAG: OsmC family protein [Candidatus Thorarchaeota archaeon]|nr:OsmC family protein [Candidatus Thorarchaeota archaeon]